MLRRKEKPRFRIRCCYEEKKNLDFVSGICYEEKKNVDFVSNLATKR